MEKSKNKKVQFIVVREFSGEKIAEGLPRGVDVGAIPVDKIHRYIQRIIDIAFKAHIIVKNPVEHAGTIGVGVGPNMATIAFKAVGFAFIKR